MLYTLYKTELNWIFKPFFFFFFLKNQTYWLVVLEQDTEAHFAPSGKWESSIGSSATILSLNVFEWRGKKTTLFKTVWKVWKCRLFEERDVSLQEGQQTSLLSNAKLTVKSNHATISSLRGLLLTITMALNHGNKWPLLQNNNNNLCCV